MKSIGIFAGSFNPFTVGHMNVYRQAEAVFGEGNIIVALGENPEKTGQSKDAVFARVKDLQDKYKDIPFTSYKGFLHDFVIKTENEGFDVTLIRGLRNGHDLQYEMNQAAFIRDFKPDIKIAYFICEPQFAHVSSSAVRAIERISPHFIDKYIP